VKHEEVKQTQSVWNYTPHREMLTSGSSHLYHKNHDTRRSGL